MVTTSIDRKAALKMALADVDLGKRMLDESMGYGNKMNTFFAKLRFKNKITSAGIAWPEYD